MEKVVTMAMAAIRRRFHLISKVFRPEFEARRIERRTGPDRNVTA